jgi:single-strand DNA-binding protein
MNEVQVTVIGTVCSEIRYSKTDGDVSAARFQIRSHPRRYDSSTGTWANGDPSYYSATCWRQLADHVASSMGVGDPVVATGKLRIGHWRRGGEKMVSAEIDVQAIGHDLRWGTSAYRRGGTSSDSVAFVVPAASMADGAAAATDAEARLGDLAGRDAVMAG